jgi:hypothetical protein
VSPSSWEAWAPPLNPPTTGGLDRDEAQGIADAWWSEDPHLCAALQWESYAATLPPAPTVASVSTGVQSVAYSPAMPGGQLGLALGRAAWHRSMMGTLVSVPLRAAAWDEAKAPAWPRFDDPEPWP